MIILASVNLRSPAETNSLIHLLEQRDHCVPHEPAVGGGGWREQQRHLAADAGGLHQRRGAAAVPGGPGPQVQLPAGGGGPVEPAGHGRVVGGAAASRLPHQGEPGGSAADGQQLQAEPQSAQQHLLKVQVPV